MELDEVTDDREAETEAAVPPRGRRLCLPEALEDVGQELGGMPIPVSATEDPTAPSPSLDEAQHDASAAGRELDGIRQQVPDDLLEADPDRRDTPTSRIGVGLDPD